MVEVLEDGRRGLLGILSVRSLGYAVERRSTTTSLDHFEVLKAGENARRTWGCFQGFSDCSVTLLRHFQLVHACSSVGRWRRVERKRGEREMGG
jgi:hypothetical protein